MVLGCAEEKEAAMGGGDNEENAERVGTELILESPGQGIVVVSGKLLVETWGLFGAAVNLNEDAELESVFAVLGIRVGVEGETVAEESVPVGMMGRQPSEQRVVRIVALGREKFNVDVVQKEQVRQAAVGEVPSAASLAEKLRVFRVYVQKFEGVRAEVVDRDRGVGMTGDRDSGKVTRSNEFAEETIRVASVAFRKEG